MVQTPGGTVLGGALRPSPTESRQQLASVPAAPPSSQGSALPPRAARHKAAAVAAAGAAGCSSATSPVGGALSGRGDCAGGAVGRSGGHPATSGKARSRQSLGTPGSKPAPGSCASSGGGHSGERFSFGMLSIARSSPGAFVLHAAGPSGSPQPHGSCGDTPTLFPDADNNDRSHNNSGGGSNAGKRATAATNGDCMLPDGDDTAAAADQSCAQGAFLDLDLIRCASRVDVDAAILGLSGTQCEQVQRLLCNPRVLSASPESLAVLSRMPQLRFLILSLDGYEHGSGPDGDGDGGSEERLPGDLPRDDVWAGLSSLVGVLRHVVCLDMSNCSIDDGHLGIIGSHCSGLRALDLSYSPRVSEGGVARLLAAAVQLEEVDLSMCPAALSDATLDTLARCCPQLSSLYLEMDAAAAGAQLGGGAGEARVSAAALVRVAQGCRQLTVLSLAGLRMLVERAPGDGSCAAAVSDFAAAAGRLESLDLTGCGWLVQPEEWRALACGCGALNTLCASGGAGLDDGAAAALGNGCRHLGSVTLQGCTALTDDGVSAMVQALPELTELQLVACPLLTVSLGAQLEAARGSALTVRLHNGSDEAAAQQAQQPGSAPSSASKGSGSQAPAWGSLMSFLRGNVEAVGAASVQKAKRGSRAGVAAL